MFWTRKPKFNPATKRMGWAEITSKLREYCPFERIINRNQWYRVPVNPAYVMRSIESYKHEHIKDRRECEGFVYMFKGELARLGYGDLLAMDVSIETPNGPHALIGFLQCDRLVFGEPQTGQMIRPVYNRINRIIY
jgi:ribosome modulation factor